jgi:hypothetical protein
LKGASSSSTGIIVVQWPEKATVVIDENIILNAGISPPVDAYHFILEIIVKIAL